VAAWCSGNTLVSINVVALHWARLLLGWVTVLTGKASRYVSNHLGQLSLPSLHGRLIEYQPVWLGLRQGEFTYVGWQVKLCDPIWQMTPCSSAMSCSGELYQSLNCLTLTIVDEAK